MWLKNKKRIIWSVTIVLLLGAFLWYDSASKNIDQKESVEILSLRDDDHVKGNLDAPITLFVYKDFQCAACKYFTEQVLSRVWPEIKDYVHVVYRYFPLDQIHKHAMQAALYAEAVAWVNENMFWKFSDKLYQYQDEWSKMTDATLFFDKLVQSLGLNVNRVKELVASEAVLSRIQRNLNDASILNLRGTPSVFLNQVPITSFDSKVLVEQIKNYHELLANPVN